MANEILKQSGTSKISLTKYTNLLDNGRIKCRNDRLVGPVNCEKNLILQLLSKVYRCFKNPVKTSFAWFIAKKVKIIFLNDFRWNPQVIS